MIGPVRADHKVELALRPDTDRPQAEEKYASTGFAPVPSYPEQSGFLRHTAENGTQPLGRGRAGDPYEVFEDPLARRVPTAIRRTPQPGRVEGGSDTGHLASALGIRQVPTALRRTPQPDRVVGGSDTGHPATALSIRQVPTALRRTPRPGGVVSGSGTGAPPVEHAGDAEGNRMVVGAADDHSEIDADRAATQALAKLFGSGSLAHASTCEGGGYAVEEGGTLRRSGTGSPGVVGIAGGELDAESTAQITALIGLGQPLSATTGSAFSAALGAPVSHSRIHDDPVSHRLARRMTAAAFTVGDDIFFANGNYKPEHPDGARLLAHELAHVAQQRRSGGAAVAVPVERKIGFEFEFSNWQTAEAKKSAFATATTPPITSETQVNVWKRIEKHKALVRGTGFELQADDDPDYPQKSDLEVVTDPFAESPAGRAQLSAAMKEIVTTLEEITAKWLEWGDAGHLPRAIDLRGTPVRKYSFLFPAGGRSFRAKPQATIGLRLEKIADVLEDLFPVGGRADDMSIAGEDAQITAGRRQGRMELSGWDSGGAADPGQILLVQGAAPQQARNAIAAYLLKPAANGAPAATDGLIGLLSLVIAYLRMADQNLVRSYAKTIAPIMARTDFGALFGLLSQEERAWYTANSGQQFFDLVQQAPWLAAMEPADEVFSNGVKDAKPGVGQAQGLTRGEWLKGISRGLDYLTGKKFPDKAQRPDMEGLGAYGKRTDTLGLGRGQTAQAAILELRAMPITNLADLPDVADRIFLYSWVANLGGPEKYGQLNLDV